MLVSPQNLQCIYLFIYLNSPRVMWASPHAFWNLVFLPNHSAEMGVFADGADRFQHCFKPEVLGHDKGVSWGGGSRRNTVFSINLHDW